MFDVENKLKESMITENDLRSQIKIKDKLIFELQAGKGEHLNLGKELMLKESLIKQSG